MPIYTFKKSERLKSRKTISRLFNKEGKTFAKFPLRLVFMEIEESDVPVQFTVSVSKRKFKRAPDRNRIKRLIREAYRLHKPALWNKFEDKNKAFAWMIIFVGKEMPEYPEIEKSMKTIMERFRV